MTKRQTDAIAFAFKRLDEFARQTMTHEEMVIFMKPAFDHMVEANVPEQLIIAYDQVLSTHYEEEITVSLTNFPS